MNENAAQEFNKLVDACNSQAYRMVGAVKGLMLMGKIDDPILRERLAEYDAAKKAILAFDFPIYFEELES